MENQGVSLTLSDLGGNKEAEKNAFWCFGRFKAWEGASDTHSGRFFGETAKVSGFVWRRTGACEKHFTRRLFMMYSHQPLYVQKHPIRGSKPQLSEGCGEPGNRDIRINMFPQILMINKYLIPVLCLAMAAM